MKNLVLRSSWLMVVVLLASQPLCETLWGADEGQADQAALLEIKPYTGPPVYLDEPDQPPPARKVQTHEITDSYPDGKVRWVRQVSRYSDDRLVADGFYREYFPNGQQFVDGQFVNGRQHGEWTYWHENGQLNRRMTYVSGQPDGEWEVFNEDGTLAAKRSFREGQRHGDWIIYDKSGEKPEREEHYVDGKASGEWKVWRPSGQLWRTVNFKDGKREGLAAEWREDGSKVAESHYTDNKLDGTATLWMEDGRVIQRRYKDGKIVSDESGQ